ncbi:hypothetical protein G4D82_12605 [Flavobacterium sp. CYK-4]|uniref:fibronectin type III domain-containing protein n=1 Tax=Flavobacterium lotistagni TaxID=2709660 RepID=UPI00140DFC1E|nr:fibronectin type III domain-containing protein [Flavobacterium lotistagni]NHM08065.1 hypothetical protein [Flavobacterium lotistagni]
MKKLCFIAVLLLWQINSFSQTTIIAQSTSWKYLDDGSNQGSTWRETGFDDTSWLSGNAELGYGDGGEATLLNSTLKPITTYFRKNFSVANPGLYSGFTLKLLRDDGAVVYLNGVEVARSNMPTGTINSNTLASAEISGTNETAYTNYTINPSLFVAGNNVLAIELHQATASNIDASFNLKLEATTGLCGTAIGLNATSVTTTTATLNWASVPNILNYSVQYRRVGTTSWTTVTSTTNSKAITGLTHSSTYEFQVKATCLLGGAYSAPATFSTLVPTCNVPDGLSSSNITPTTATLNWTAVTGATSYNIQYRKTGTTTWTTTTSTSASKALTGLTAATGYDFQVQAVCLINSAYSPIANFSTLAYSCGTPTALSATSITGTSATISWAAVSGATSYNLQYRIVGTTAWTTTTSSTTSKALTGLTHSSAYEFQVQAVCVITSAYSTPATFNTLILSCGTPTLLTVNSTSLSGASVSWAAVSGATSYKIQYRKTGTTTWSNTTSTTTTKSLSSLSSGTFYEFQVQAVCAITGNYSTPMGFSTLSLTCGTPSGLTATTITTTAATLSWNMLVGSGSYNLRYRRTGTTNWTTTTSATNSKAITGLTAATAYEFQVQGVCAFTGSYSASGNFSTLAICNAPTGLTSSNLSSNSVTVTWNAVSNAVNYNIQYRPTGTTTWQTTSSTTNSKSLTDLAAATTYEFQVQTVCGYNSEFSALANFSTFPICETPTALNADTITWNTAQLSWQAVSGVNSYNVQYRVIGNNDWFNTTTTNTSMAIENLSGATQYEFQVQAVCATTSLYSAAFNFTTLPVPTCDVPTGLTSESQTTNTASLIWQPVTGATGYNVQYRPNGNTDWIMTTVTSANVNLNNLLSATNYEVQVQALCIITSAFSASFNFRTLMPTPTCEVVSGLSVSSIGAATATLSWQEVSGANGYNVQYRKTGTASWNSIIANGNSVFLSGLSETSNYECQVQGICTVNNNFSELVTFTTLTSGTAFIFPASSSWKYLDNGTDQGTTWPNNNFDDSLWPSANAEFGYGDGDETTVVSYGTDPNAKYLTTYFRKTFTVNNPAAYSTFSFDLVRDDGAVVYLNGTEIYRNNMPTGVIAFNTPAAVGANASEETAWNSVTISPSQILSGENVIAVEIHQQFYDSSDISFNGRLSGTIPGTCETPSGLNASAGSTSATLNWLAASGAVSYNIQYRAAGSSNWNQLTSSNNSILVSNLTPNTNYEFQVQSVCSFLSAYSALATFSTLEQGCDAPVNLSISTNSSSSILLSWDAVSGASSYTVEYQLAGANAWIISTSNSNSKTISGLIASTGYEFRVKTNCTNASSPYSAVLGYTTNAPGANTLIAPNATWKYLDNGSDQNTVWQSITFDDSAWKTAAAEFGYGDSDETTIVNYGPDAINKYVTTYFRKSFNISNPAEFSALSLGVVRDDGIVVYLNGTEVFRNNLPTGTITYNTLAIESLGGSDEYTWLTASIDPSLLVTGTNVLAVEVHQQSVASSDLSFNAKLTAPSSTSTPVVVRGAYLQKLNSNSITIRWRTDVACNSAVQFGTTLAYGNVVTDNALVTDHIVTISGLTPSTKYFYTIGTTTETLQGDTKNNFITAPVTGTITPVRIWGIGDFGNGTDHQLSVRNSYMNYTGSTPTNLWIWLGDDAYTKGEDPEFQSRVFAQYPDQFKNMPLFPTMGNHDYADVGYLSTAAMSNNFPYFSIFSLPENGECGGVASNSPKYYSYNYANIHFISLDTYGAENTVGSPMRTWLENDLAANTQRWTVVYMHHPPYTLGTHNSDTELELIQVRQNIVPLLESYKVDLVLAGHSHVNERSYMMKGHLGNSTTFSNSMKVSTQTNNFVKSPPYEGTVYAVCGTSGQDPEVVNQPGYPMAAMYFNNNTNNCSLVIDVNGDILSCKYLASTGSVVDNFTITKTTDSAKNNNQDLVVVAKDALDATIDQNRIHLDYKLVQDADLSAELINLVGEKVMNLNLPAKQTAGIYDYEIPLAGPLSQGLYFIRMMINGKPIVKKVYVIK